MKNKFNIPLIDNNFQGRMPEVCLFCGKPKDVDLESQLTVEKKNGNKTEKHLIKISRSYCNEHAKIARRNGTIASIIAIISFLPAIVLAVWMWVTISKNGMFGITEGGMLVFLLIVGVAGGAFIGFWIGMLILEGLKSLVGLIVRTPLDHPLAILIALQQNPDSVLIKFNNKEVAGKFYELNKDLIDKKDTTQ